MTRLRTRYGSVSIVQVDRSAWDPSVRVPPQRAPGVNVRISRDEPFVPTWNRAMAALATRRRAAEVGAER
jgi:hypothetical protein